MNKPVNKASGHGFKGTGSKYENVTVSRTPASAGSTPKVGEHNEEVLGGLLGYSEKEIAQLYANGVIGNAHEYDSVPG